jgi:SAM-dependent methyltransferase
MTKHPGMFSEGDGYELFMGRWSRRLAPLFVDFAMVGQGDVVLDVGCGTGAVSFAAAEIPNVRVTGIDPSSAFLRSAQGKDHDDRVRFQIGDASALHFADTTFDRTLSMLVVNFLPEPAAALREMIRMTLPNGVVAAAVWDYGDAMEMLRAFWDAAVASEPAVVPRDERHMPLTGQGELTALWRSQGLQDVEDRPLTIEMTFKDFDDYWQPFLSGQGPAGSYTVSLSDSARETLRGRLRRRLVNARPDAGLRLQARAWAVRGVVPVT